MIDQPLKAALAAIDEMSEGYDDSQQLVATKCRALMHGYHKRWKESQFEIEEVEVTLTAPVVNPDTNRNAQKFSQAGKIDAIADYHGRKVLIDHKTASQDISDPNAPYWRQLVVESQVNHYMLLGWLNGMKFDYALWDVMRKPSIAPKKLAKKTKQSIVATREYCGLPVSQESLDAVQVQDRETLELYELRLRHDCTIERPDWYFQRRTIPRMDHELIEYAKELWNHSKDMLHERKKEKPARNSGACMLYGSPCKFLGVCSGHDSIGSDKWKQKERTHNELPLLEGDGNNVLTNSRVRCFQTCRMKHFYEYELGVEQQDAKEKEALFFGSAWHVALESYFLTLKREVKDGSCQTVSANGVE